MEDKKRKIATIILAGIFIVMFALVGIGSCGGIRYLLDNRSIAQVYADEIGSGDLNTTERIITVPLDSRFVYTVADGYYFLDPVTGLEYYKPFVSGSVIGDLTMNTYLEFKQVYNGSTYELYVSSVYVQSDVSEGYVTGNYTLLPFSSLVNSQNFIVPVVIYASSFTYTDDGRLSLNEELSRTSLYFAGNAVYDPNEYGQLLSVYVDVKARATGEDLVNGSIEFSLYFQNGFLTYNVIPYKSDTEGSVYVNRHTGLTFNRSYGVINSAGIILDFEKSYQAGYDDAVKNEKPKWKSEYFNQGYNKGLLDANDYSFLSLIGAVVDVPVQAFIGLTDFELLGFNMTTLYKSLFGICLIIIVFRLVLP